MNKQVKNALKLAFFDFDHTIINSNSDTYIDKLIINRLNANNQATLKNPTHYKYPNDIEETYKTDGWTARMNAVLKHMFQLYKINSDELIECIKEIKIDESMLDLIKHLKEQLNFELIIISDANTVFIDTILKEHGIDKYFTAIYTNPASFHANENYLQVTPLSRVFNVDGEPFNCTTQMCTANICKGSILEHHVNSKLQENSNRKSFLYVGDGRNDYCGGLKLDSNDFFFVRQNFSLEKLLISNDKLKKDLKANILFWKNGQDILKYLKQIDHL